MEIGTVVADKYRLTRPIGRGGMGAVFEAEDVRTGQHIALKMMFASKSGEDEGLQLARFQREALAIGKLDTPHVVRVYDAGVDPASHEAYIAMELLEGEDVSHLLKRLGPLPVEVALAIVAQACAGLAKAHEHGIVHRDIKPGNIFLARQPDGEVVVKILDFGIAKVRKLDDAISSELGTITETGTLVGSPYYMSPEQAKGLKSVDHRADLWSLGVVLFKCLSGRTPFDSHSTLGQVILAVCGDDAPSVQTLAPWVPPEVADVIHRALQRQVALRFQSAAEMQAATLAVAPNGARIAATMLRSLPDEIRSRVAPPSTGYPESGPSLRVAVDPAPMSRSSTGDLSRASFAASADLTVSMADYKRRRLVLWGGGAFALIAVLTFAAGVFVRLSHPPIVTTAPATSAMPSPEVSVVPSALPSPPASSATSPAQASASAAPTASTKVAAKPATHVRSAASQPMVHPSATATASAGSGRLHGGVGGDVPF